MMLQTGIFSSANEIKTFFATLATGLLSATRVTQRVRVIALAAVTIQEVAVCSQHREPRADSNPAFEVVSIRPSGEFHFLPPDASGRRFWSIRPFRYGPQSVNANQTLRGLIEEAYSVDDWEVQGPDWIATLTYEISAKFPANTARADARLMLRTALAERFGVVLHRERKPVSVLALVEGKRGFKLQADSEPGTPHMTTGGGAFEAAGTIDDISESFRTFSEFPVVNLTGIQGSYHFRLHWTVEDLGGGRYDPRFWEALENETGLKADKRKMPRDIIVVDQAQREPIPN